MLRCLEEGELRGIASVGVLGEGFDLPKLKIAVYHQRHTLLDWQLTQGGTMMLLDSGPADLADMELMVEAIDASSYRIRFEFDGVVVCSTIIDISGRAHADGLDPIVVTPDGEMALTEALSEWPHCTCFADGSSVYGSVRFPGPQEFQAVPPEVPSRLNRADVGIRRESKPNRDGRSNIQQRIVDWAHEM